MRVIGCEMMADEIRMAMKNTELVADVIWLERGLHNSPEKLGEALQREIDKIPQEETVVLAFAQCGNGTVGLKCNCEQLIIPKFSDCIHLIMSNEYGSYDQVDSRTFYNSKGWMDSDCTMKADYERAVKQYGQECATEIYGAMLQNYKCFCLMDTGAYDMAEQEEKARETAELFHLEYKRCKASLRIYEKLFNKEWDDEFVVKKQGEIVSFQDFY